MIEREQINTVQQEPNSRFDAILVHGYWMSEHQSGLGLRTRLSVRAAALAYDKGQGSDYVVLPLGHLWGQSYPSTGDLMATELHEKYDVPKKAIIRGGDACSTSGEINEFVDLADEYGWEKLLDIAFSKHFRTIPLLFKNSGYEVQFESVENILEQEEPHRFQGSYAERIVLNPKAPIAERQYEETNVERLVSHDYPHIDGLVRRLGKSRYELAYNVYEAAKLLLMRLPGFNPEEWDRRNRESRKDKGKEFIFPVDVYKL